MAKTEAGTHAGVGIGALTIITGLVYTINAHLLNAWPDPHVWGVLMTGIGVLALVSLIYPAIWLLALAGALIPALWWLRTLEIAYALEFGRLTTASGAARATAWVALSRDILLAFALWAMWRGAVMPSAILNRRARDRSDVVGHRPDREQPGRRRLALPWHRRRRRCVRLQGAPQPRVEVEGDS